MKVGVLSDTHGYYDPRLGELFKRVDAIIHAGDVGSQQVLDELAAIAPVEAVEGNVDSPGLRLPLTRILRWEGVQIEVLHILPVSEAQLAKWPVPPEDSGAAKARQDRFVTTFHPATRVVVFGHSHQPFLRNLDGRLFVNPGSAGKKRFSLPRCCASMTLRRGQVQVKILSLEDYNQSVPESVELTFGE